MPPAGVTVSLAALSLCVAHAAPAVLNDLQRVRARVPRKDYRGDNHAHVEVILNHHLARSERHARPCSEWTIEGLHAFVDHMHLRRSKSFQSIYAANNDSRRLHMSSPDWKGLMFVAGNLQHRLQHLQHALCRESVMLWTHHLSEDMRGQLRVANIVVPMMAGEDPELPCAHGGLDNDHFCKTLELKGKEINCHANQPCLQPPCGPGPFPLGYPTEFVSQYHSPSKKTTGMFAVGKDRRGKAAGLITMEDGSLDHLCSAYHNNTPCTELAAAGWRWLVWPKLQHCCKCCTIAEGCGPLNPTWLQNASGHLSYKGIESIPHGSSEQKCMKWDYEGLGGYNYYYEQLPEGRKPGLPCAIRGINYMQYPNQPSDDYYVFNQSTFSMQVSPSLFDLPSYCKPNYCGISGTVQCRSKDPGDPALIVL